MTTAQNGAETRRRHITPADFFSHEGEKTKLNWFLFEYALELEMFIRKDKRLRSCLGRKGVGDEAVARFCIHHAKQMEGQILDRVAGKIPHVRFDYEPIEAYFPTIGDPLVDRLLARASEAWESQTDACVVCPTRCVSEKDRRAPMFDDPDHWQ